MAESPAASKMVFSDDFKKGLENWVVESWEDDKISVTHENGQMHVSTRDTVHGTMLWCRHELPVNFTFEFDVTPLSESGFFLIFFNTHPQDGGDILDEKTLSDRSDPTLFKKYTKGKIDGYHISYRRNEIADCNLRKNSGMVLLKKHVLPDLLKKDKTHHVSLTRKGGLIRLEVNGKTFMEFIDDGQTNGKIWTGGRIGLRQVYDSVGAYDNVVLKRLD